MFRGLTETNFGPAVSHSWMIAIDVKCSKTRPYDYREKTTEEFQAIQFEIEVQLRNRIGNKYKESRTAAIP